jgi:GMP synthase PP-ATPase subunit
LLRKNEFLEVDQYKGMGLNVRALMLEIDFVRMAGVSDPETKRKLLDVFYRSF